MWLYIPTCPSTREEEDLTLHINDVTQMLSHSYTWRETLKPQHFWLTKWKQVRWIKRLFGLTPTPSTANHLLEEWMQSLEDSHVNHSQLQEEEKEQKTNDGYGKTSRELFLENVPGLFRGGIQLVVGELSTLGYDARWITLRANEVGSPHRRERVFILAHSRHDARSTKLLGKREGETIVTGRGSTMADTSDNSVCDKVERNVVTEGSGRELEDTNGERLEGEGIEVTSDVTRSGRRPYEFPPGLTDPRWEDVIRERPDLAPSIPTEPTVRAVAHGMGRGLARSTKLKLLGNGVVPKQAAVAYGILKGL